MFKGLNTVWAYARAIKRRLERGNDKGSYLTEYAIIVGVIAFFILSNVILYYQAWELLF